MTPTILVKKLDFPHSLYGEKPKGVSSMISSAQEWLQLPTSDLRRIQPYSRNVFVRDATSKIVASVVQPGHYQIFTFYRWLSMILNIPEPWFLRSADETSDALQRTDKGVILPGDYIIVDESQPQLK